MYSKILNFLKTRIGLLIERQPAKNTEDRTGKEVIPNFLGPDKYEEIMERRLRGYSDRYKEWLKSREKIVIPPQITSQNSGVSRYRQWLGSFELLEKEYKKATSQGTFRYHSRIITNRPAYYPDCPGQNFYLFSLSGLPYEVKEEGGTRYHIFTFTEDQVDLMARFYEAMYSVNGAREIDRIGLDKELSVSEIDNICLERRLAEGGYLSLPRYPREYLPEYRDMLDLIDKGDYETAAEIYYKLLNRDTLESYTKWILPGVRRYECDELLYLKCLGNIPLTGRDLNLYKPRVSPVIKRYQSEYLTCIDRILEKRRRERMKIPDEIIIQNMPLIKKVAEAEKDIGLKMAYAINERIEPPKPRFSRFATLLPDGFFLQDIFGDDEEFIELIHNISIDSENMLRDNHGIPRISEGWIAEMELYNLVKERSPDAKHEVGPPWLKPQRLDVFVPSKNLAFEYNGRQHYEPVEFFGGKEGFEATKERDQKKRERCKVSGVILIEWKYTEPITCSVLEQKLHSTRREF